MKNQFNDSSTKMYPTFQITPEDLKNKIPIHLPLEDLGKTPEEIEATLQKIVDDTYAQSKDVFEHDRELYGNRVKNGTYKKKVTFCDPLEDIKVSIYVRMQKYLDKDTGITSTFYGGIMMPRISTLAFQAVIIVANREDYEAMLESNGNREEDKVSLREFCKEWAISVRAFRNLSEKVRSCYEKCNGQVGRFRNSLLRILEGDYTPLTMLWGFAN